MYRFVEIVFQRQVLLSPSIRAKCVCGRVFLLLCICFAFVFEACLQLVDLNCDLHVTLKVNSEFIQWPLVLAELVIVDQLFKTFLMKLQDLWVSENCFS